MKKQFCADTSVSTLLLACGIIHRCAEPIDARSLVADGLKGETLCMRRTILGDCELTIWGRRVTPHKRLARYAAAPSPSTRSFIFNHSLFPHLSPSTATLASRLCTRSLPSPPPSTCLEFVSHLHLWPPHGVAAPASYSESLLLSRCTTSPTKVENHMRHD